jgi:hypothetical protein
MPVTYENIATTTLGSAATSITFSSITSAYTDLRIVFSHATALPDNLNFRFNSDSGTNYSDTYMVGDGTAASSTRNSGMTYTELPYSDTANSFCTYDIFSYAGSTFKTGLATYSADKNGTGWVVRLSNTWRSTSAITSITMRSGAAGTLNFPIGTTATLYGILRA